MIFGKVVKTLDLRLGDVVRYIPFEIIPFEIRSQEMTKPGHAHDYRQGYDVMTVSKVDDMYLDFKRPYWHSDVHDVHGSYFGVETVSGVSRCSDACYELLRDRS